MAEKRTRRQFTATFKAQAVKRLLESGCGLPPEKWKGEIRASCCHADVGLAHVCASLNRGAIADA
jgi:hypothetical protein